MSTPSDPAAVLLVKAREDAYLAKLVKSDRNVSEEQMGFLCQQAIEKSFKSVLSRHGIQFRRGHDMAHYLDLLKQNNIAFPPDLEQSVALTPFGAQLRYDFLPPEKQDTTGFDRESTLRLVEQAVNWAATFEPAD